VQDGDPVESKSKPQCPLERVEDKKRRRRKTERVAMGYLPRRGPSHLSGP